MLKLRCLLLLALLAVPVPGLAALDPGWGRVDIPATHSFFWRYIPESLDASRPAPVVLFFHGADTGPTPYKNFVSGAAERARCVVAMPQSSGLASGLGLGWGGETDERTVTETLRLLRQDLPVDDRRIAVSGHSAGGAWAYLLAYSGSTYSAVFTLASPAYPVSSIADPAYKPPIRMYYGTQDPNYTAARPQLEAQWSRLGVSWEEDVQAGYDHSSWPDSSMADGFLFLVSHPRPETASSTCVAGATTLCLNHGRFRVEVSWDANGTSGPGRVVPGAAADSGLFWFFGPDNWELLVKVIDGCAFNGNYWVFSAATTDVHYALTVTDTASGRVAGYENPAGKAAEAITDTGAFPTCP